MMEKTQMFEKIADNYSLILLNWAYKKLGNREEAEDLTQEVFLQIYSAITKSDVEITKIDNFIWKIAHYTWCNYLRKNEHYKMQIPIDNLAIDDETDFVNDFINKQENEAILSNVRKSISRLSYLKREIMISFYIDGKSIKDIAGKYGISEANVKWHLHKTRNDIKEDLKVVEKEYVYRPRSISMGISGVAVANLDVKTIDNSLTMQNICYVCYDSAKSMEEISEILGIPMAYIESDLKWLVEKEFVVCSDNKYATSFIIEDLQRSQDIYNIYCKHKKSLSDVIINGLIEAEDTIRNIGFYGNDTPMDKMLWLLIINLCLNKNDPYYTEAPVRPDGGKYFPLGFDRTDYDNEEVELYSRGWGYNGPMGDGDFLWFGTYNFGKSEIEDFIDSYDKGWADLKDMLIKLIKEELTVSELNEDEKLLCAELSQKGYITINDDIVKFNFYIFSEKQYEELKVQVYKPILKKVEAELNSLKEEFISYFAKKIPGQLKSYKEVFINMAIHDIGFITTVMAFNDGKLYVPESPNDGEFLTMLYFKR